MTLTTPQDRLKNAIHAAFIQSLSQSVGAHTAQGHPVSWEDVIEGVGATAAILIRMITGENETTAQMLGVFVDATREGQFDAAAETIRAAAEDHLHRRRQTDQ